MRRNMKYLWFTSVTMMARYLGLVLFTAFIIEHVTGRHSSGSHTSDLLALTHLGASNNHPLIVLVNAKTLSQKTKDSDFDDVYITGDDGFSDNDSFVYEDEAKEQAKQLLYSYLLRTGDPKNTEENEKRTVLREVLRARCKSVVQCKKKCENKAPKKKYCPKSCKAVFDKLNLCKPPKKFKKESCDDSSDECGDKSSEKESCEDGSEECGNKSSKKNKKNSCDSSEECGRGKTGRTLPPTWRF